MFTKEQLEGILISLMSPEVLIETDRKQSIGYRIRLIVKIRARNLEFLSLLQETLDELGVDSSLKEEEGAHRRYPILRITKADNLLKLFQIIPNIPKHCNKFDSFLEALTIFSNRHHLQQKGFDRILELKGLL
tara:strand:- start:294 stop:692 length:399 start_codon:yes stop_codon:yes gene_type:complete